MMSQGAGLLLSGLLLGALASHFAAVWMIPLLWLPP